MRKTILIVQILAAIAFIMAGSMKILHHMKIWFLWKTWIEPKISLTPKLQ